MPSPRSARARFSQLALSFGVSAALIGWLIFSVEWPLVWSALRKVRYGLLIPLTVLILLHFLVRAVRWRFLLPDSSDRSDVQTVKLFNAILVGAFATFVLPLRAGELVRPLMLSRQSSFPFGTSFASVVIERFFDLSMVLVSFGLMLPHVPGVPGWVEQGAYILTTLAVGLFVFLVLGSIAPTGIDRFVTGCLSPLPERFSAPLLGFVRGLLSATVVLKDLRRLVVIVSLTVVVWGTNYLLFWGYLWLFDIPGSASFSVAIGVIIALAVAAPSAPGFIGVYQTACVAAFTLFGFAQEEAIAYSLVSHVHQFVLIVVLGFVVLLRQNISLGELRGGSSVSKS